MVVKLDRSCNSDRNKFILSLAKRPSRFGIHEQQQIGDFHLQIPQEDEEDAGQLQGGGRSRGATPGGYLRH